MQLGVANRNLAVIESITPGGHFSVRLDNNRQIECNTTAEGHFDHGYAVTSHSAQGLTAARGLIDADTGIHYDLLSSRFGCVAVSYSSRKARIFADEVNRLGQQFSTEVSKTTTLQMAPEISSGCDQSTGLSLSGQK